jgi:assimilatory nitrate reductase catalytic subunit
MPIHWSDSFASAARTDTLVAAICDPISGQPAFKQTPVEIKPVKVRWQAILLSSIRLPLPGNDYWAYRALGDWHMYILAGNARLDIKQMKKQWRKQCDQWAEVDAGDQAMMRLVGSRQGRPTLWMALHEEMPQWNEDWLLDAIKNPETSMRALLLGMPLGARLNKGSAQICTCNQVDEDRITEAISKGCSTVECVGKKTRAGTTCGSCIPEIRKLLTRVNSDEQEEVLC